MTTRLRDRLIAYGIDPWGIACGVFVAAFFVFLGWALWQHWETVAVVGMVFSLVMFGAIIVGAVLALLYLGGNVLWSFLYSLKNPWMS